MCAAIEKDVGLGYGWPGNVRDLEQAVRRIILTRRYQGDTKCLPSDLSGELSKEVESGTLDAQTLLAKYCRHLFLRYGTYEQVARQTKLDRRTVKKYIQCSQ